MGFQKLLSVVYYTTIYGNDFENLYQRCVWWQVIKILMKKIQLILHHDYDYVKSLYLIVVFYWQSFVLWENKSRLLKFIIKDRTSKSNSDSFRLTTFTKSFAIKMLPFIVIDKIGKTCCYERITRSHKREELRHLLSSHVQVSHRTIKQNKSVT